MKKIISFLLISTMILFLFFACVNKEDEEGLNNGNLQSSDQDIDLMAYTFVLKALVRGEKSELMPPADNSTHREDMLLAHYRSIEDKYNCKIKVEASEQSVENLTLAATTNDKWADLVNDWLQNGFSLAKQNYIVPLEEFSIFDDLYSGKWGDANFIDAMSYANKHYGSYPSYLGIPTQQFANVLYVNPKVLQENNVEHPHEYIEKKNWVWDSFERMCTSLVHTDENGKLAGSINVTDSNYAMRAAIISNGAEFAVKDENGRYMYNLNSAEAIQAMEWFRDQVKKKIFINNRKNEFSWVDESFITGDMAFSVQWSYHGTVDQNSMAYRMEDGFSWAPFPCGPSGTYGDWSTSVSHASLYLFIPLSSAKDNKAEFEIITNAIYDSFEGETGSEWKETFIRNTFFDDKSAEIYFELINSATLDFTGFMSFPDFLGVQGGSLSASEAAEKIAEKAQSELDENINAFLAN